MILSDLQPVIASSSYKQLCEGFFSPSTLITPFGGGATRHDLYRINSIDEQFVLRLEPDEQLLPGVDPARESKILNTINSYDWAPIIVIDEVESGALLMEFAGTSIESCAYTEKHIAKIIQAINELHQVSDVPRINYQDIFERYRQATVEQGARSAISECELKLASLPDIGVCLVHHDLHPGNLCWFDTELTILDWEYAGKGNPWLDYAVLVRDIGLKLEQMGQLTRLQKFKPDEMAHHLATAIEVVDQLELIWHQYRERIKDADMQMNELLYQIKTTPNTVEFADVMAVIEANYNHKPSAFVNGDLKNGEDQNQGSAKLLAFAQIQGLNEAETLSCFGTYYRDDVLGNPEGTDHGNIRNFMNTGWAGVQLPVDVLTEK